ncbi:MAG: hypothetical protein H6Q56_985 [Deltaproteobacteria bacterium]|nr:hypothetical protein [Deltaproteobacteria bacterium]
MVFAAIPSGMRFMSLSAMHPLIGLTEWTDARLDTLDKGISDARLFYPSVATDRAEFAQPRQSPVHGSDLTTAHGCSFLPAEKALPRRGPTP